MRRREPFFANINLLGRCELDCPFCLGHSVPFAPSPKEIPNHQDWPNLDKFLDRCRGREIDRINLTGLNVDPLQYEDLSGLCNELHEGGFKVGLRTNGLHARERMAEVNAFDSVGYTHVSKKWCASPPDVVDLVRATTAPTRVSFVMTEQTIGELWPLIWKFRAGKKPKYLQIRKVWGGSDADCAMFDQFAASLDVDHKMEERFCEAPTYTVLGMKVVLWTTVETTANSLNYFIDGTISDEYVIVGGYNVARALERKR